MSLGRKIFVMHGRDKRARRELFVFLRSIGLAPMEWTEALREAGGGAPLIGDILDTVITKDRAFLVLLTPDEDVALRQEHADDADDPEVRPAGQPRPNVFFEAGMALAKYPEHTVFVEFGKVRKFTDIAGRFVVKLDNSSVNRHKLALRLQDIGCEVDLSGTDWHKAGDLTPPAPGQRVLPRPTASGSDEPAVTSEAGRWQIDLENFAVKGSRHSGSTVFGEITSREQDTLTFVLKGTFYGASQAPLGSAIGLVNEIGPGERRPFELTTTDKVAAAVRVRVYVEGGYEV
jgi:hypothetical protein